MNGANSLLMGGNFTEYLNYLEQIAHGSGGTVLLIRLAEIKSGALGLRPLCFGKVPPHPRKINPNKEYIIDINEVGKY